MIRLITPSSGNQITQFSIYGYFNYLPSDPTLNAKTYLTRFFFYRGFSNGSASGVSPFVTVNVPVLSSRNNFLNQIEAQLTTNVGTLGSLTVTAKNQIFYGTDPVNPTSIKWEWEIIGTVPAVSPPKNIITIMEYELSGIFQTIIPANSNAATITYT